jgi:hypothetical protein
MALLANISQQPGFDLVGGQGGARHQLIRAVSV